MVDDGSMAGRKVGHYQVSALLGAGGMGEVYRAEDTRLGRQVALKFLPPSLRDDPERRARLLREAQAAARLHSPSTAATFDISEIDGALFIAMEYVDGETLSQRLERGPLSLPRAVRLAMQVADALDEAHGLGIIHRDIKSANLMITERGRVKVLDFGLTKLIDEPEEDGHRASSAITLDQPTALGVVMGTVSYMSPEQALGQPLDHRSDLFSLGIVMYEMVAGKLPFVGNTALAVSDAILHAHPAPLSGEPGEAAVAYERIVHSCIAKSPAERVQTAKELHQELRRVRQSLDAIAYLESSGGTSAMGNATAMPQSTGFGVSVATPEIQAQAAPRVVAVMPFVNITSQQGDDWIGTGIAETVTADLKELSGFSVIGSERVFDALQGAEAERRDFDERVAIELGRRLGATWIVLGGYQRVADALRITARRVEVASGTVAKTVKVDGAMAEIFALQDRIVADLGQDLSRQLGVSRVDLGERERVPVVAAFECYSRGLIRFREATRDSMDQAILFFEKAVEIDPEYARAWGALAAAYGMKGQYQSLPRLFEKAVRSGLQAVALDPRLPEAHQWLGGSYIWIGQQEKGIEHVEEAIRLDPENSISHMLLSRALWLRLGQISEATLVSERALRLSPESGNIHMQLGLLYTLDGRYEEAEAACRKAIELQKRITYGFDEMRTVGAQMRLGYAFYRQGRYTEAMAAYRQERSDLAARRDHMLSDRTTIELKQKLGAALLRDGQSEPATRYLGEAIADYEERRAAGADDPFTQYYIACAHALSGDSARALDYFRESSTQLAALNRRRGATDPDLETIREQLLAEGLIAK